MAFGSRNWQRVLGLVGAVALGLMSAMPAMADNKVTQTITCNGGGNGFSASITDAAMQPANFSTSNQNTTGLLKLTATESGCNAQGWHVTVLASGWAKDGTTTVVIPANSFSLTSTGEVTQNAGQPTDPTNGPKKVNTTGTLENPREVADANAGYGLGTYKQDLNVQLTIPGYTAPATYFTTMTVSMTVGP